MTYPRMGSSPGPQGPQGPAGIQGIPGLTGLTGAQGVKGDTGVQGIQGAKGDTGVQGSQGAKGDTGLQGVQGLKGDTGIQGIQGVKGDPGVAGVSFAPQSPVVRSVTVATALQHTDVTKPFKIIVNVRATQTITVAGTTADKVELRIGPSASSVAPSGSGGFSVSIWESGITGVAVMVGAGVQDGGCMVADAPAGWYFQLNRISGTSASVVNAFTQSLTL